MGQEQRVFVNVVSTDPWWLRWLYQLHMLKLYQTFSGTRGFRKRYPAVTVFTDIVDDSGNREPVAEEIAAAVAEIVAKYYGDENVDGYILMAPPREGNTSAVGTASVMKQHRDHS